MTVPTPCPGCGVELAPSGWAWDPGLNASPECWQVYGEVAGFEMEHLAQLGSFHQLLVDAYGAQHPGDDPRSIRIAYSLVGLHLALVLGRSGPEVRRAHQRMGKPAPSWPLLSRPAVLGSVTALDVARDGARARSVEGHALAMRRWAKAVWGAWSGEHEAVASLAARTIG